MILNRRLIALSLAGSLSLGVRVGAAFGSGEHAGRIEDLIALNRAADTKIAGTYRCWSENVGGRGGRCAVGTPPLVLNTDGTYSMSSEHGTYKVSGDTIILSESKLRGAGHIAGGNQIVFEYDYRGLHHTVAYLRQ
jgi:hypothetical protein